MSILTQSDLDFFRQHGYIVRSDLLSADETDAFGQLFDDDRAAHGYRWHSYGHHQVVNYDALVTSPGFDDLIRHPLIMGAIDELMGGPTCFGEIGARFMSDYDGDLRQSWHRDKAHWPQHDLRMDYLQSMVYLTDVDATTHCFSLSPESVDQPVLDDEAAQLERGGVVDIHGPAGTVCLFNVSVLHTATTRATRAVRKTVQTYYGHREHPYLANDSIIPPLFWKHDPDPETRAFYGNLNEVTRLYMRGFGIEPEE
jgi:ectoine hydroxylase-related dioxygenase (phytanoyl-CoA dioxygenase family)